MITFHQNSVRFTYRVAGIALLNNHVLCEKSNDGTFYNLPGGRAELHEAAPDGLIREMREELDITITVVRLVYIIENFFTHNSEHHHELGLYFLMTFPPDCYLYANSGPFVRFDNSQQLHFEWLSLNDLRQFAVYPSFLYQGLQSLPEYPVYLIHNDG